MKIRVMASSILCLAFLSACQKQQDTTHSSSTATQEVTSTSEVESSTTSSDRMESTQATIPYSDVSDVRTEHPVQVASQLRRQLYEAGINSRELSDAQLEAYAKEADEQGIDPIVYIQTKLTED